MGLYEGLKDIAKIIQKADNIVLYQQLLDLCSQALDMQQQITCLINENIELKKQQNIESSVERHSDLYITLKNEDSILYCSHCWDNDRKLIQVQTDINRGKFSCPHCKSDGVYDEQKYNNYIMQSKAIYQRTSNKHTW